MKIAVLDLHRWIHKKTYESIKIKGVLKDYFAGDVNIFEMIRNIPPDIDFDEYNGILISGSDSTHIEKYRGYKTTQKIMEEAKERSIPVLGVCAGNQMLARIFDQNIEFMAKPEVGWYEIELTDNGIKDELFNGLPKKFVSFECHIKRIYKDESKYMNILAKSKNCIQSVRYDKFVWGIQFHPEDTIEIGNEQIGNYNRREPSTQSKIYNPQELVRRNVYKNFVDIVKNKIK